MFDHETGQELKHLEDEAYFGEMCLFNFPETTDLTVAIEVTEVFYLTAVDFIRIMRNHPDLFERAKNVALVSILFFKFNSPFFSKLLRCLIN